MNSALTIRGKKTQLNPVRTTTTEKVREPTRDYDPDAIRIRFFNASHGPHRTMDNSCFNDQFTQLGVDIVVPTQIEWERDRRDFNTNWYIVVKKSNAEGNIVEFGEAITVNDKTFNPIMVEIFHGR